MTPKLETGTFVISRRASRNQERGRPAFAICSANFWAASRLAKADGVASVLSALTASKSMLCVHALNQQSEHPITVEVRIAARECSEKVVQHALNDTPTRHSRLTR